MRTILTVLALSLAATAAHADPEVGPYPRISVETDPSLFALDGYGFSVGASAGPHWHLQVTEFASDLYKFATPSGWHARIGRGTFLWARYFVHANNEGLFTGITLAALEWRYTRPDSPGAMASQDQYAAVPFVGYRWFPTSTGLYVLPWAGVGLPFNTVGDAMIGTEKYKAKFPVFPLVAVHVGWEFGR